MLLGCALRRSELAALDCGRIQQRDGCWAFVDLVGKGKRIGTVPIPPFVKVAIDAWKVRGRFIEGPLVPRVRRRKYPEKTPQALRGPFYRHCKRSALPDHSRFFSARQHSSYVSRSRLLAIIPWHP